MLTDVYQALLNRLAQLDTPVFQADCIPQGQTFPYLTLDIALPLAPQQPGKLTLTAWCHGAQAHADRLALADAILALLPLSGTRLEGESGRIILLADDQHAQCIRSGEARGVKLTWKLQCFPCA